MSLTLKTFCILSLLMLIIFLPGQSQAMKIQEVTSPGGIKAWLVQDKTVPMIAMRFAFTGGSGEEPSSRMGVTHFLTAMMNEGAGDMTSLQFQNAMKEKAIRMSFSADRDRVIGSLETLSAHKDRAFELLGLALSRPRFDEKAIERVRTQLLTGLKFESQNPSLIASQRFMKKVFKDHPYARPVKGTIETVKQVKRSDLIERAGTLFGKNRLLISVVGDISKKELGIALDKIFDLLPRLKNIKKISNYNLDDQKSLELVKLDIPQSVIQFGLNGIPRKDKDFIPAFVMNYILGGGGFSSRLVTEIREKRGLTYSVYSYLLPFKNASMLLGGASTKNENAHQTVKIIIEEIKRMAKNGVSAEELKNAKTYLTGSYALRFDSNSKIAGQLLGIRWANLGIDYPDKRNDLIRAVTGEDIKRVAKRLLKHDQLKFTIVGQPVEDLSPSIK